MVPARPFLLALTIASASAAAQAPLTWEPTSQATGRGTHALTLPSGAMIAVVPGALLRSTDDGRTWAFAGGPPGQRLAPHPDGEALAAGGSGILRSDHEGTTWTRLLDPPPYNPIYSGCQRRPWRTYAGATSGGTLVAGGTAEYIVAQDCAGYGANVLRRPAGAADWDGILLRGALVSLTETSDGWLWAGIAAPINDWNVPDSSIPRGLHRSADDGATWTRVPTVPGHPPVLALLERSGGVLLAGTGAPPSPAPEYVQLDAGTGPPLLRSTDGGATWAAFGAGLYGPLRALVAAPEGALFAAMSTRIFRSTDEGATWEDVSAGLPPSEIYSLTLTPGGHLLVGLDAHGFYRSEEAVVTAGESPPATPAPLLAVTPNPSGGPATVALTLAAPGRVRAAVYDALGREVAALHDGPLGAGRHALVVPALAPGVYVVRAVAGEAAAVARLVVAR